MPSNEEHTLKNMRAYSISPNGLEGRVKSPIIYGHWGNTISPLAYIQKPKWVSDEDFARVVKSLCLELEMDNE